MRPVVLDTLGEQASDSPSTDPAQDRGPVAPELLDVDLRLHPDIIPDPVRYYGR